VTPVNCPAGTYSKIEGLVEEDDCWPCKPGYYCSISGLDGTVGNSPVACDAGYFCKTEATSATPTTDTTDYNFGKCPDHHYCASGAAQGSPCWPGTEADSSGVGLFTVSTECTDCPST